MPATIRRQSPSPSKATLEKSSPSKKKNNQSPLKKEKHEKAESKSMVKERNKKLCLDTKEQRSAFSPFPVPLENVPEQKYLEEAVRVAYEAGEMILEAFNGSSNDMNLSYKDGNINDLVTDTDKSVEQFIINSLTRVFPSHKFIGEEGVAKGAINGGDGGSSSNGSTGNDHGSTELTNDPTWIIDPIDGTTNFVHRLPLCCTSIGLWVEKKPVAGVVYNPVINQMGYALAGHGSYLNGLPIKVTKTKDLKSALLVGYLGNLDRRHTPSTKDLSIPHAFLDSIECRGFRELGSAALHLVEVAKGSADAVILVDSKCWDIAAGVLIVEEAGGVVGNPWKGIEPLDIFGGQILAGSTPELVSELSSKINIFRDGKRDHEDKA